VDGLLQGGEPSRTLEGRFGARTPVAALAAAVIATAAIRAAPSFSPRSAAAACNVIPQARATFRGSLGSTSRPFAAPGEWVTLQIDPACHGASPGFPGATADQVVTLVFTPPAGPRTVVVLAADCEALEGSRLACEAREDVARAACLRANVGGEPATLERVTERVLRFRFPATDPLVAPEGDGIGLAGPATLAVTGAAEPLPCELAAEPCSARPGLRACIDRLFAADGSCGQTPGTPFAHFTALPPPNNYQTLCIDPIPPCDPQPSRDVQAAVDAAGNTLVPVDWRGVLVNRDAVPVARFVRGRTPAEAFPGRGVPLLIPDQAALSSFSPEGARIEPVFDPQADPTGAGAATFFGTADAPQTVLRIARHDLVTRQCAGGTGDGLPCLADANCAGGTCGAPTCFVDGAPTGTPCASDTDCPGGECGPGLFDFSTRLFAGVGPVLLPTTDVVALDPVPLDGLNQTADLNAFVLEEAIPLQDLNGDGDLTDSVVRLGDRLTGQFTPIGPGGSDAIAVARVRQPPFSFPGLVVDDDTLAFLEPEGMQGFTDENLDGDRFDTILRVFRLGGTELTDPARPLSVDAAPLVNGRSLVFSGRRLFFRVPESGAARRSSLELSTIPFTDGFFETQGFQTISANGRVLAFDTGFAPGAVPRRTLWIYDLFTRQVEQLTVDDLGTPANGTSWYPRLSADGNLVAFVSGATNWVPADGNGVDDVFVRDRAAGTTERVSVASSGDEADGSSAELSIHLSSTGRFVVFTSDATNLVPRDTNGVADVFVRDRATGTTERVSVSSTGAEGNSRSSGGKVSEDGRFVAFSSDATNLVESDTNGVSDVFVRDRRTGATERVSLSSTGVEGDGGSFAGGISADGQVVSLTSNATNLVAGDTDCASDVFTHDRRTHATVRHNLLLDGREADVGCHAFFRPDIGSSITADGRFVGFASDDVLITGCGDDFRLYLQDRLTGLLLCAPASSGRFRFGGEASASGGQFAFRDVGDPDGGPVLVYGLVPGTSCGNGTLDAGEECDPPLSGACPGGGRCSATCECNDLTGDGTLDQSLLGVLDATSGTVIPLCAAEETAVAGGKAAFLRHEAAEGTAACPGGPLNDDADVDDLVVQCWPGTGPVQNLGRAATAVAASDTLVAALVSEAGDAADYDSDGDQLDDVVHVHPACSGNWTNISRASDSIAVARSIAAFTTPEADQGAADLNLDGDTKDRVVGVFDASKPSLVDVGQAAEELVLGETGLVAFRTREESQGARDLNLDGDVKDAVLQVFDPATGDLLNSLQAVTPCLLEACDPRVPYRVLNDTVKFLTFEADQGVDLNGDFDTEDLVLQVLNVRRACHTGSMAGACHALAATTAGVCTSTGAACATDATCGSGTCFLPPGGCIRDIAGSTCNPGALPGTPGGCMTGQFCQPILGLPGQGFCRQLENACRSSADCQPGASCSDGGTNFNRLVDPFSAPGAGGAVFTGSGRCVEDMLRACVMTSDCEAGEACDGGACRREQGECASDADCPAGVPCVPSLLAQTAADSDRDELPDAVDHCPFVADILQEDTDRDGVGDACDVQTCGNDIVEPGEGCDDGNQTGGDACEPGCLVATRIAGTKLLIKDGTKLTRRKLLFVARDAQIDTTPPAGIDPARDGVVVQVYNTNGGGDAMCLRLPPGPDSWKVKRKGDALSFSYKDGTHVNGPCTVAMAKDGKLLRVVCDGKAQPLGYSLDERSQGRVAVRVRTGGTVYCAEFGGTVEEDQRNVRFLAVEAPAPAVCPAAPSGCP
jgi:cysteine-rich repeat protein